MKITREKLIRLSETYIQQRAQKDRTILCAYITGSMLNEYPFIAGTTDVDIIMIHNNLANFYREVVPVNDDATLDIYHYPKEYFDNTRDLRYNPWLGSSLCFDPIVLYGKGHWFEFILSSTEATFFLPEVVLQRVRYFNSSAHRSYFSLKSLNDPNRVNSRVELYLKCISDSINALACLNAKPLALRREFPELYALCAGQEERMIPQKAEVLISGMTDLSPYYEYFYKSWGYYMEYFSQYAQTGFYAEYSPCRLPYYLSTVEALWENSRPSALWIMLNTWVQINKAMKMENSEPFNVLIQTLHLDAPNSRQRLSQMDQFLETIDDVLDEWAGSKGLGEATEIYTEL